MTASEIRALATRAGVGPGVSVLDVGCGTGGPGRFLTRELGCDYLGVDFSPSAVALAREYAAGLPCRYAVAHAPPLPGGRFDVVLLLEAMLAVEDQDALIRAVAAALAPGGRFAFTLEEGPPLTAAERAVMPDPDTVWLTLARRRRRLAGPRRPRRHVGGGPQRRAPCDGAGADRRLRRRRRGHHRAARPSRARRHPRRPPAVGRVAGLGAGAQVRPHRFRARLGATRGGSSGCFG